MLPGDRLQNLAAAQVWAERGGDAETGVEMPFEEMSLVTLEPLVATTDGEEGGSGERVKYTTFASEPPI